MDRKTLQALGKELADNKAIIEIYNPDTSKKQGKGASSMMGQAASALAGKLNSIADSSLGSPETKNSIKAQYNPSSVRYSASAREDKKGAAEGNQETKTVTAYCTVKMTVELVFHSCYELDDSVEKQMGRMLGFMMKSRGRNARFYWSNMVIEGEIESFSSEYNMFDSFGNPVSGTMNLTICSKDTIANTTKMYQAVTQERPMKPVEDELGYDTAGKGKG